jgi:hypothetical protein
MKQRFPSHQHLKYFYDGVKVENLPVLIASLRNKGLTSMKLTAKKEFSKIE